MKRFIFSSCVVMALTFSSANMLFAHECWHSGPGPMGAGAEKKPKSAKTDAKKPHFVKAKPLYDSPKSVGRWHKSPGPMGA